MLRRLWFLTAGVLFGALLAGTFAAPVAAQLSPQVLLLLTRNNTWTGVNIYGRAVGLQLERATLPLASPTDRLENRGGNLYFNNVLVAPSAGAGTVTSVALALPNIFTISGSPVTSSGTLTGSLATQTANLVWAGPSTGSAAAPTFRALVAADIPAIPGGGGITGQVAVANGGTGLSAGTSGGVPYFSSTSTMASSGALTVSRIVLGGGAGAAPTVLGSLGTTTTVLHGNAAGAPTFAAITLSADVTGTLPVANGGTGLASGTSGGIPYFSGSTTIASSAALTASRLVIGGGAGATPTVVGSLGTTTTLLHGNAAGAPTFGAVTLTTDVSGTLPVTNGGSGLILYAIGDLIQASATTTLARLASVATGNVLLSGGVTTVSSWGKVGLTTHVSGALPVANGGTALTATPTNGQLAVGNGTNYTLATLTGTSNQITVTNGVGTITLSLPQAIATASTPNWARIGLGTGAGATAVLTTAGLFDVGLNDVGNCGAAATVTWTNGMVQKTSLTAATCTLTFAAPTVAGSWFTLEVIQDNVGGRLVTWPTIAWDGGSAPTLSTTANKKDVCRFFYDGAAYLGQCIITE